MKWVSNLLQIKRNILGRKGGGDLKMSLPVSGFTLGRSLQVMALYLAIVYYVPHNY